MLLSMGIALDEPIASVEFMVESQRSAYFRSIVYTHIKKSVKTLSECYVKIVFKKIFKANYQTIFKFRSCLFIKMSF